MLPLAIDEFIVWLKGWLAASAIIGIIYKVLLILIFNILIIYVLLSI